MQKFVVCFLIGLGLPSIRAEQPDWWTAPATSIGYPIGQDYAVANIGQLKNVATQAKKVIDAALQQDGLSPSEINDVWTEAYNGSGSICPFPFSTGANAENAEPATVGQLKFIAYGFYKILNSKGYEVRETLVHQGFPAHEVGIFHGMVVPWNGFSLKSANASPATVGQLKMVFSFGLGTGWASSLQLPLAQDLWSVPSDDHDGDLLSTTMEWLAGTAPADFTFSTGITGDTQEVLAALGASGGPVVVLPQQGIYAIERPSLKLNPL